MVIKRNKQKTSGDINMYKPIEHQAESMESSSGFQEAENSRRQAIAELEELVSVY